MSTAPRERLILTTIELIRSRGVSGVAVNELLSRSGTARQSIYTHFPQGKNQLVEESARTAGSHISAMIEQLCSAPPLDALRTFVECWKSMIEASDYTAGCPIAAATFGGHEAPGTVDAARVAFSEWEQLLADNLRRSHLDDTLAQSLATMVIAAIEGAVIMSVATRSTRPLDRVGRHLGELLEAHLGEKT
ncbi:TetR/AcrR family transcriptional regulator [Rhodococcus erythropolis]|uniref:TetR/AcrR family transcriptional regulator n=1 Tax=Rhodococcus erythropolis TaxID=1833 RepID=UPI001BEC29CE|nr:TetR/AcrR family transcriptional regulator [Rhodococcus erythropolis]MBT2268432.1 TetR/AcrR family transcriptional regulator [Rhodococcus erythropolis]